MSYNRYAQPANQPVDLISLIQLIGEIKAAIIALTKEVADLKEMVLDELFEEGSDDGIDQDNSQQIQEPEGLASQMMSNLRKPF